MQRSVDYVRTLTAQARSARANRHVGFALALLLCALAIVPALDDVRRAMQRR